MPITVHRQIRATQVVQPPSDIVFTEGVAQRISVAAFVQAGADRYNGGYFYPLSSPAGIDNTDYFRNIYFDPATLELVYDGQPLSAMTGLVHNPNNDYWVGWETGPYTPSHWSNPTLIAYPSRIAGAVQSTEAGSKHIKPRFCPYDNKIYFFGGDYSTVGIYPLVGGDQDGRMTFWRLDPATHTWDLAYPAFGRVGEEQPLSPDVCGFSWDPTRQIWWITPGNVRAGFNCNNASDGGTRPWQSSGGLSDAYPKTDALGTDWPAWTFDPKLAQPKYTRLANVPWNNAFVINVSESCYDDSSKRLYNIGQGSNGLLVRWLDTTLYDTNPSAMTWASEDIDLRLGAARNLTGSAHVNLGSTKMVQLHVDAAGKRILWLDAYNRHLLALTLPGNAAGTHYVQLISDWSSYYPSDSSSIWAYSPSLAYAETPFIWVPEHRCVVLVPEPQMYGGGPIGATITIDVDSGTISAGPRLPSRPNNMPWHPNMGCWNPVADELFMSGCFQDATAFGWPNDATWGKPSSWAKYSWVP